MYEFPYGAGQQLNLNWIINEIITLHKQLDPDWDLPQFDTAFPYTNLNTLNLDWILRELKAIKDLAPAEDAQLLKMVANALIANTYDATTQYNVDDIVYRDNDSRLYKCITATPAGGEPFDNNKWVEVDVGGVLTDLLTNQTVPVEPYDSNPAMDGTASAGTSTQYARGDHVHPKDTARVPTSRTVNGKALSSNITLNASDIPNDSNVTGDNVDDALDNLNGALNLLKNRRFVFISDSYGINNDRWIGKLIENLGLTANDNAFNVSLASTGFVGDPNQSGDLSWKTLLTNNIANITNKDTITDIIVCGGTNDTSASYVDLYNAVRDFKTYALSQMPNAKISIGFIGRKNTGANNQAYGICAGYYQELATKYGMAYIPNAECCWGFKSNYADTWHPNANGYALIAACIANYILTGTGTAISAFNTFAPTKSGLTSDATTTFPNAMMSQIASNGLYTIGETDVNAIIFPAKTITCNDSWQELLTIPNAIVAGNGWSISGGSISVYDSVNGNYPSIPCLFRYYDNKIWVKMPWKGYTGTADFSCTSTQIKFAIPMLVMPMKGN